MSFMPIRMNTVALTIIALIASLGMIVRYAIQIPIVPDLVELTPGFLFSILGGVLGGIPGGIITGAAVGSEEKKGPACGVPCHYAFRRSCRPGATTRIG